MAEVFLSASIHMLIEKLLSPDLLNPFAHCEGVLSAVCEWRKMLWTIEEVLDDAEEKQIPSEVVKKWLQELRDLAYDMEDVLDELATERLRANLRTESQGRSSMARILIHKFTSFKPSAVMFDVTMASQMKEITSRLQEIVAQKRDLGLGQNAERRSTRTRGGPDTDASVTEYEVYGREEDKEAIVKLLLSDNAGADELSVISIVGMAGVGKTTLANLVYNDDRVMAYFDLRARVCVPEEFDLVWVTGLVLEAFTSQTSDVDDLDSVQVELKNVLSSKKFLLVLDDVWQLNYNDWTILCSPFKAGLPGSKIIVTTCNRGVSETIGTLPTYTLKELSNDDCLSIFTQHSLGARDFSAHPNLKRIGEQIVKRCKGLPLAATALGGLLFNKVNLDEWENVLSSKIWDLPEEKYGIIPALRLSYYYLPPHLKQCFAYCAIFPKDYAFEEEELVRLWIAVGLVEQRSERNQIEDIGGRYFRDLLSRSFFQLSGINNSRFVMHDLISELAQFVAGETIFRLEDKNQCKISRKARHSSYVGSNYDGVKKFEVFDEVGGLQTFLPLMTPKGSYLTNNVPLDLLPKFRYLRVLSLSGYHITELPSSIGNLKHLRYLDLSFTYIRSLPKSICNLYNLQTLILNNCSHLKKLPIGLGNLINLRHLDISGACSITEMPPRVGKLTSLQTLSTFVVGNHSGAAIRELINLQGLRGKLCISRLENVIDARDARMANLQDKKFLDVLTMEWSSEFNDSRNKRVEEEVLDTLEPHTKLKKLTIRCYGGIRLPAWIGFPSFSNMVFLMLENCAKCTTLPPLGQLPSLKDLCIERVNGVHSVGLEFYGDGCPKLFPSLETLRFGYMEEWEVWLPCGFDRQVEVFPCLRELSIESCPKLLRKLPDKLPTLEKLIIHGCQQLVVSISSLPKLSKLDIKECKEVVQGNMVDLGSVKSMVLSNISNLKCLTDEFLQGLTKVEDLKIVGCNELAYLWQKEVGLLQHLTSLRRLRIRDCLKIVSLVAEEAGQLQLGMPCRLEFLELYCCNNLEKLQGLHCLTSLRKLTIHGCPRLVSFSDTGLPSALTDLRIELCDTLKSLPRPMIYCNNYASLENLHIDRCNSLTSFTRGQLPSTLRKLEIKCCKNFQSLLDEEEGSTSSSSSFSFSSLMMHKSNSSSPSNLEHLSISWCPSLTSLSPRGELPTTLKHLYVYACPKLESVAQRLDNNTALEHIEILDCKSLKSLPEGLHNLIHLSHISICNCPSLVYFPNGGLPATKLRHLWILYCEKLEALPDCIHNLTSLQELSLGRFPRIVSFPEEGFPTKLTSLEIIDLKISKALFEHGLYRFTSLRWLNIKGGYPHLVSFPEDKEGFMLPNLTRLSIEDFPTLKCLSSKGFQNLTSLEELRISACPKLKSFPKEGLPPTLLQLYIYECPLLQQRCKKDRGVYWRKIAHIPCVYIDGRFIFGLED